MSTCWIWPGPKNSEGYGLLKTKKVGYVRAHRAIYEAVYGSIPKGRLVMHKCDNPPCINPRHLFEGTVADNNHDMTRKGRGVYPRGVHHGMAKLNNSRVRLLRSLRKKGQSISSLARQFGLAESTIVEAAQGQTWRHISSIRGRGSHDV